MRLSVLGAGAWGTALACHAAGRGQALLWARDADQIRQLRRHGENVRYLPGIELPDALRLEDSLDAAVDHAGEAGVLVLATPMSGLRDLAQALRARGRVRAPLLALSKGFERGSGLLPHQVLEDVFTDGKSALGVLSGPSFAQEVARGLPVALTVASRDRGLLDRTVAAFHHGAMRIYASSDVVGVEVGGAVKNVLAIACGVSDGLSQGHNARAALITRGLAEMARLGAALGANPETFMGLSGLGDLVLTCTGELSRNRRVGLQLAAGKPLAEIVRDLGHVAEGVQTAPTLRALARAHNVDMPITDAVCDLLDGHASAAGAVQSLLARDPRAEIPGAVPP